MPSTVWKREVRGERWYPGETISRDRPGANLGHAAFTRGNDGNRRQRWEASRTSFAQGGQRRQRLETIESPPLSSVEEFDPETIETIKRGLWMVVNREGTGRRGRILGRDVIGKTRVPPKSSLPKVN